MNQTIHSNDHLANRKKMDALAPETMKTFWAFDRAAGAELVEAALVSASLRAGGAVTHASHLLK